MMKGQQAWIRVRGAPNDPESFDIGTWSGIAWEIRRVNTLGDTIWIQIPNYLVIETLPESTVPESLYREGGPRTKNDR
jgi:hypothetical protein